MKEQMQFFASRITPEAVVTLLKSANPPADLAKARIGILMPCVNAQIGEEEKRHFLDAILEPLCRNRPEMAIDVLEMLAKSDDEAELPEPKFDNLPRLWLSLFRAMHSPGSAARKQDFFDQVQEHTSEKCNAFALPFESSATLCNMYIDMCKQNERFLLVDLDRHEQLLAGALSRNAVFEQLMQREDIENNDALLALLYFTWWAQPGASIPLKLLPKAGTGSWELFKNVTSRVKPNQKTVAKGMSILARFATAPHTLPASILNTLKASMVGGDHITSKTFVLAQQDSTTYPVYAFRTHTRHLPMECINHLIKLCMGDRQIVFKDDKDKIRIFFPWTDSGVSASIIKHNLNILVNISLAECKVDPRETCNLQAQLFLTTLTWFESAGFTMEHLKQMCSSTRDKEKLAKQRIELRAVWEKDNFAQMLVYQSLPVYVDVRFCSGKDVPLFQSSEESIAVTIQWLAMLTIQYSCTPNAPQEFYEFAAKKNNQDGSRGLLKKPAQIVAELFKDIADKLARAHAGLTLVKGGHHNYHVILVLDDSGSMDSHWTSLVAAVKQYLAVRQGLGTQDLVSIVIFNNVARIVAQRMPLADCVANVHQLLKFVGGGTDFGAALKTSLQLLESQEETLPAAMLFMSDGSGGGGEAEMTQIVAKFSGIKVNTMAFGQGADGGKLQALANLAGSSGKFSRGEYFLLFNNLNLNPCMKFTDDDLLLFSLYFTPVLLNVLLWMLMHQSNLFLWFQQRMLCHLGTSLLRLRRNCLKDLAMPETRHKSQKRPACHEHVPISSMTFFPLL